MGCIHSFRVLGTGLALIFRMLEAVLLEAAGVASCVVKATVDALGWVDTGGFKGHTLMGVGGVSKPMLGGGVLLSTHKALST